MAIKRTVTEITTPQVVIEGAGVRLRRSIAPSRANPRDPFLLFDHFAFNDPLEGPIRGFPMHPHRGIETVTYMLEGSVHHRDSLGNTGLIGPGDVQWMTSGRGILHEEMPRRSEAGNVYGFQLWVNLPAAKKMGAPRYQEVSSSTIPVVRENHAEVRVVAGEYCGVQGPVRDIAAEALYLDVTLEPDATFVQPISEGQTAIAYVFEGEGEFGVDESGSGEVVSAVKMLAFSDGSELEVRSAPLSPVRFMLITGTPFKEPIAPYGPFVMNTMDEIRQTLEELRNGTFISNPTP